MGFAKIKLKLKFQESSHLFDGKAKNLIIMKIRVPFCINVPLGNLSNQTSCQKALFKVIIELSVWHIENIKFLHDIQSLKNMSLPSLLKHT